MSRRKAYEEEVKQKLDELEKEIDSLRNKLNSAESDSTTEHHGAVDKLHELKEETKEKFSELLEASDEAWEELQEGVEHYWAAVGNELKAFEDMD